MHAHPDPRRRYVAGVACGACYIAVGVFGAALGQLMRRWLPLRSALARGALFGMGAHGAGTAKARELEEQRSQAVAQGDVIKEELMTEGRAKEREIIDAATREMEEVVAKMRDQIAAEMGQARGELKGQIQSFGEELARKILGRSIQ